MITKIVWQGRAADGKMNGRVGARFYDLIVHL